MEKKHETQITPVNLIETSNIDEAESFAQPQEEVYYGLPRAGVDAGTLERLERIVAQNAPSNDAYLTGHMPK